MQLRNLAIEEGILIEPGDVFFHEENPPSNNFRLGYSAISAKKIEPGIKKLAALIHKLL